MKRTKRFLALGLAAAMSLALAATIWPVSS